MSSLDMFGMVLPTYDVTGMLSPVICRHCGKAYDLTAVPVIAHFGDCTVFNTPCCGRRADDRTWKSLPDFRRYTGQ